MVWSLFFLFLFFLNHGLLLFMICVGDCVLQLLNSFFFFLKLSVTHEGSHTGPNPSLINLN